MALIKGVLLASSASVLLLPGCESKVVIASWNCPPRSSAELSETAGAPGQAGLAGAPGQAGAPGTDARDNPVPLPWSTGFENAFCDYPNGRDSCVAGDPNDYEIVSEPVHSGTLAAAFHVSSAERYQVRCALKGDLPPAAYYSAWYYIPSLPTVTSKSLWNLYHFEGLPAAEGAQHSTDDFHWDISIVSKPSGDLRLEVFSYLFKGLPAIDQSNNPAIPIGSWFHIEMYLKRAADTTGEVRVYQDGALIFELTNAVTDRTNSSRGDWYLGNYAKQVDPLPTVYVDDISMAVTRQP